MNSITGHPKSREKNPRPSNTHWASDLRKSHEREHVISPIRTNGVKPCKDCKHYDGKVVYGRGQVINEKVEENVETVTRETRQDRERRLEQGLAFYSNWIDDLDEKATPMVQNPILPESYESARRIAELRKKETENDSEVNKKEADFNNDNSNSSGTKYPKEGATTSKHSAPISPKKSPHSAYGLSKHTDGKVINDAMTIQGDDKPWLITVPGKVNNQDILKKVGQGILNRNNWSQKNITNQQQNYYRIPSPQYNTQHQNRNNLSPKTQYNEHLSYPYIYDKTPTRLSPTTRDVRFVDNYNSIPRPKELKDPYIHRRNVEIDKEERPYEPPFRVNSLAQFYNPFLNARNERNMQLDLPRLDYDDDDPPRRPTFEYVGSRSQQSRSPSPAGASTRRQTGYWTNPPNLPSTTRYDPPNSLTHGTLLKEIQCARKHAQSKPKTPRQFDL